MRSHVPAELEVDTFDGTGWVGVAPFRLTGLRLRGLLPLPYASSFLELNVRTCVRVGDRAGVYFLSLDASSRLAVEAARLTYRLPYFHARMSVERDRDELRYVSERIDPRGHGADLRIRYRPTGEATPPPPGSREHFLTERYCLFTLHDGDLQWAQIHHPPWPLQPAEADIEENTMPPPGLELAGEPICHFSASQDVLVWPLERFELVS